MLYMLIAIVSLSSFPALAWQSEFDRRDEAHQQEISEQIRAAQQNYYARIHQKIATALGQRFGTPFYASGKDYIGGSYACAVTHAPMGGAATVTCMDAQNRVVHGLSSGDLRKALGCSDYMSYFVAGDISKSCKSL